MAPLFWIISAATMAGGITCCFVLTPKRVPLLHLVALALIALGASLDAQIGISVAPSDMYVSQAMIGFAAALFLPPAMAAGLISALQRGPQYILSFIIIFLSSQILGATIGSGLFRTLIATRTLVHGQWLTDQLMAGDALVSQRLSQIAATLSTGINDAVTLKAQSAAQLGAVVSQQATIAAYQDAFHLMTLLALFTMAVLLGHILLIAMRKRIAAPTARATASPAQ